MYRTAYLTELKDVNGNLYLRTISLCRVNAERWLESYVHKQGWLMYDNGVIDAGSELYTYTYSAIGIV